MRLCFGTQPLLRNFPLFNQGNGGVQSSPGERWAPDLTEMGQRAGVVVLSVQML